MLINVLLIGFILLRLIIGARLIVSARQNNLPNLYWLAAQFFLLASAFLFSPAEANPLSQLSFSLLLGTLSTLLAQPALILFNQTTFYQNRKSPAMWFWGVFVVLGLVSLYGVFISASNFNQSPWVAAYIPIQILLWGWHGWLAYQARASVLNEPAVEDWIKSRYQLIVAYSILIIIAVSASFLRIVFAGGTAQTPFGTAMVLTTVLLQSIAAIIQFLVWVMPEVFRRWLNRNQKVHEQEYLHKKASAILNILGTAMAQGTGAARMITGFSLREAIGKAINSQDPKQIEARAVSMGYNEWLALVDSSELQRIVTDSGSTNAQAVVNKAKQTLIENQSLFTLQAK